jgi:hypothetical protein
MFLSVDGEPSWISHTASHAARHRHFLALMVDAPGSLAPLPKGLTTFPDLCQCIPGATMSRMCFSKKKLGPCAAKDLER